MCIVYNSNKQSSSTSQRIDLNDLNNLNNLNISIINMTSNSIIIAGRTKQKYYSSSNSKKKLTINNPRVSHLSNSTLTLNNIMDNR